MSHDLIALGLTPELLRKAASLCGKFKDVTGPMELAAHYLEKPPTAPQSHALEDCAKTLLMWISGMDANWAHCLQVMRDERGYDEKQCLGAAVSYVLDHSLYMVVPRHEAFAATTWGSLPRPCPVCGKEFTPDYPNRPQCSNRCSDIARRGGAAEEEPPVSSNSPVLHESPTTTLPAEDEGTFSATYATSTR